MGQSSRHRRNEGNADGRWRTATSDAQQGSILMRIVPRLKRDSPLRAPDFRFLGPPGLPGLRRRDPSFCSAPHLAGRIQAVSPSCPCATPRNWGAGRGDGRLLRPRPVDGRGPARDGLCAGPSRCPSGCCRSVPAISAASPCRREKSETEYQVYYGGDASRHGTRPHGRSPTGCCSRHADGKTATCRQLESVRQAYETSSRLGSDYVSQVYHRHNPFDVAPAPFLSHYAGTLHISVPGLYQFFTSSEDSSFLLIDEQTVVSSPGRHGPAGHAQIQGRDPARRR